MSADIMPAVTRNDFLVCLLRAIDIVAAGEETRGEVGTVIE